MLGILGQSEYGLIGTANSITSYLSLLSMGIGASYVRFNAQARATGDKEKEYRTNGMFQTIYIVISIVTLIVGMVLVFLSPYIFQANYSDTQLEEIKWIMICTVIQFVITFLFNTTAMTIQAYERFVFLRLCLIIAFVFQPCINFIVALSRRKCCNNFSCNSCYKFFDVCSLLLLCKKSVGSKI